MDGRGRSDDDIGRKPGRCEAPRSDCHRNAPPIIRDGFPQPPARYSRNGVLETTLRASVGPVRINGERVIAMNYERSFPGPTLVVCAGDRMVVNFENDLLEPTNLHTHGHVSPRANHDNVYVEIEPGERFKYEYRIPDDHPPGAYWYHPHRHMLVEPQIFGGLSGAIVVEGGLDRVPGLRRVPQRWMVIQSTEVRDGRVLPVEQSIEADTPLHINGVVNPTVKIRPGQLQRWRLFNANDNRTVVLRLAGHRMWVLAEDGNTLPRARAVRKLMIPPGSRREILVRGGRRGRHLMKALPFAQFPGGDQAQNGGPTPNQTVLTVRSSGRPAADRVPRGRLGRPVDLRRSRVDRRRRIVFDERPLGGDMTDFLVNGHVFDPNRVVSMELGKLEESTLVNRTTEWHTFHIHVNDFQVVRVKGRKRTYVDHQDNVAIPPRSSVVIRQRPTDFTGKLVFHCHVTFHEDHGMMSAVQVVRPGSDVNQLPASPAPHGGVDALNRSLVRRALEGKHRAFRNRNRPARAAATDWLELLGNPSALIEELFTSVVKLAGKTAVEVSAEKAGETALGWLRALFGAGGDELTKEDLDDIRDAIDAVGKQVTELAGDVAAGEYITVEHDTDVILANINHASEQLALLANMPPDGDAPSRAHRKNFADDTSDFIKKNLVAAPEQLDQILAADVPLSKNLLKLASINVHKNTRFFDSRSSGQVATAYYFFAAYQAKLSMLLAEYYHYNPDTFSPGDTESWISGISRNVAAQASLLKPYVPINTVIDTKTNLMWNRVWGSNLWRSPDNYVQFQPDKANFFDDPLYMTPDGHALFGLPFDQSWGIPSSGELDTLLHDRDGENGVDYLVEEAGFNRAYLTWPGSNSHVWARDTFSWTFDNSENVYWLKFRLFSLDAGRLAPESDISWRGKENWLPAFKAYAQLAMYRRPLAPSEEYWWR